MPYKTTTRDILTKAEVSKGVMRLQKLVVVRYSDRIVL